MAQYFGDLIVTDVCLILGQSFLGLIEAAYRLEWRSKDLPQRHVLSVYGATECRPWPGAEGRVVS
jgi:hypothetical protein